MRLGGRQGFKEANKEMQDVFLNSLCLDVASEEGDDFTVLEIEHIDDDGSGFDEVFRSDEEVSSERDQDSKPEFEYNTHDPKVKWNKMRPLLGERYESPHQMKLCLTNHAIYIGYKIKFKKCDSVRLVVVCASDPQKFQCPFNVMTSWISTERCVSNYRNTNLMGPTWLGNQILKDLIRKPKLKCKEMQSLIEWNLSEHYAKVWDYGIKIYVSQNQDNTTTFQRMYICFKEIKEGWIICKGKLLTAIGRDGNNQVYSIAWIMVDIENKLNWK
uniref:Transposase MuDR plant domain-containing protein n=1 Tax=Lactuca sativa TaxID=4236 RepID=A0A9R1UR77_LACSA|nr:hypothetical protein LSAT_V11C800402560 [Lactuca sativa]